MQTKEFFNRIFFRLRGRVIHLKPKGRSKGIVLFSYVTLPFLRPGPWDSHTNYWEGENMVEAFLERGYEVDVIDSTDQSFIPKKRYNFFVDNSVNMERLSPLMPNTKKIFHITNAEPHVHNAAGQARADALYTRRGVHLSPDRNIPPVKTLECADVGTALGNSWTIGTYGYAHKPITRIPLSTTHTFEFPEGKNFDVVRKQFVWIGGAGPLHKGLDLVLEAFSKMPEYSLAICGKFAPDDAFARVYSKELYQMPNIKVHGFLDPGGQEFKTLCTESVGVIFASCAEGGGGSVILGMHAGLIPIVNKESSVDVEDFGILMPESTVETIKHSIMQLASLPIEELKTKAMSAWNYARAHHTREKFAREYRVFLDIIGA